LRFVTAFYWDRNDRSRAIAATVKTREMPVNDAFAHNGVQVFRPLNNSACALVTAVR
jgi:hypothetical protein